MCIKHMPKKCNTAKQIWYDLWVFKKILLCISDAFILRNDGTPCYHILSFKLKLLTQIQFKKLGKNEILKVHMVTLRSIQKPLHFDILWWHW